MSYRRRRDDTDTWLACFLMVGLYCVTALFAEWVRR